MLSQTTAEFEKQSRLLFTILSKVKNHHTTAQYLSRMLLRINFNDFFTQVLVCVHV